RCAVSATDREPGKAAYDDILTGLAGEGSAQLLDRLAALVVLVHVLLPEQPPIVEPLLDLALHDPLAHVLGAIRGLLDRDPLLPLALLRRNVVVAHREWRCRRGVQRPVPRERDEPLSASLEVRLAVDLDEYADLVAG